MLTTITRSLQKTRAKSLSEQGFSLLEALVGVLVITLILVAITPPILLSSATRVQNRRAEQAMQLAQAEVERIRVLVAQGNYNSDNDLPDAVDPLPTTNDITSVSAPTKLSSTIKSNSSSSSCSLYSYGTKVPNDTVLPVDVDGDCQPDFLIQIFRDKGVSVTSGVVAFHMGVRVYSAQALQGGKLLTLVNPAQCASLKLTNGLGRQQSLPLAVFYTTIARSDATYVSLQKYNELLTTPSPSPSASPSSSPSPICGG